MNEFSVGQLAKSLYTGYFGYLASTTVARHPYTQDVIKRLEAENAGPAPVPIEAIIRKDSTAAYFDLSYAMREITTTADYQETHDRLWLGGALLILGDELAKESYFGRGPDLEFVRHLRNGVAHGNQFNLLNGEPRRPTHFTGPDQRGMPDGTITAPGQDNTFEITSGLHGQKVLFDFMGPGDVTDFLMFVSWRLIRIGNGDPPMDLWPQCP
ncbi:MAG: hypothetical protein ACLPQY_14720 [Streptosporangiaceae bacterium]